MLSIAYFPNFLQFETSILRDQNCRLLRFIPFYAHLELIKLQVSQNIYKVYRSSS